MLAAISAVFDTEESSERRRRKSLLQLRNELVTYVRQRRHTIAIFLCAGRRLAFAVPDTQPYEYIARLKSSLEIGRYKFTDNFDAEAARALADLEAAIIEYWESRFSHPSGAPGER